MIDAADVIIQVLDSRDPQHCRSMTIEREIQSTPNKKLIQLLNKVDLVPPKVCQGWQ